MQTIYGNVTLNDHLRRYLGKVGDQRWGLGHSLMLVVMMLLLTTATSVGAQEVLWTSQFGSTNPERASAVASDATGVFVAGQIDWGSLNGTPSMGSSDGFVRGYSKDGAATWTRQFGTTSADRVSSVGSDPMSVYVAGSTMGAFAGQTSSGAFDAFVTRLDRDGQVVWSRQFGSFNDDAASGLALHSTGTYVCGWANGAMPGQTSLGHFDAFVARMGSGSSIVWLRQFGSTFLDKAHAIAVDDSGVYVVGEAWNPMPGQVAMGRSDAFIRKYDHDGNEVWTRQFGTTMSEECYGVAVNASGVYVVGRTNGTLPGQVLNGDYDAFIRRYDLDGTEGWTQQFGDTRDDYAFAVGLDADGAWVTGRAIQSGGDSDAFVCKFDLGGSGMWNLQMGTTSDDDATAISIGQSGAYVAGSTDGELPGQARMGGTDAFVAHLGTPDVGNPVLSALLDVMPGDCENPINATWAENKGHDGSVQGEGGNIVVAIVADGTLDLSEIDMASLSIEGATPKSWDLKDVAGPPVIQEACPCSDDLSDGVMDLELKFRKGDIVDALGLTTGDETLAITLTGLLLDGTPFEASDCVYVKKIPEVFLAPAAPNPFNPVTMIQYELPQQMSVKLSIYDVKGRLIEDLVDEVAGAGIHTVTWQAEGIASGTYFYRLQADEVVRTQRVVLLK